MAAPKPVQLVSKYENSIVALTASGDLFGQVQGKWEPIPGPEDGGRIISITTRPNGGLVAVTATGQIYEQYRSGVNLGEYGQSWRLVPSIPQT
jgi:hypothetical protein